MVSHYGTLFRKTLHMLRLAAKEGLRDKKREIGVFHTLLFETAVKLRLNSFPDGIAIGFDDHTSAYGALLSEVGFDHQLIVPLRVILAARSQFLIICHCIESIGHF